MVEDDLRGIWIKFKVWLCLYLSFQIETFLLQDYPFINILVLDINALKCLNLFLKKDIFELCLQCNRLERPLFNVGCVKDHKLIFRLRDNILPFWFTKCKWLYTTCACPSNLKQRIVCKYCRIFSRLVAKQSYKI